MNRILDAIALAFAALAITLFALLGRATAGGENEKVADPIIGLPQASDAGAWHTKVQQVFDSSNRSLFRRAYTVWSPGAVSELDFGWVPADLARDKPGPISGEGRLVWRLQDKPSYDKNAAVAEYHGTMRNGRAHGAGAYLDRDGFNYEGHWRNGRLDGHGVLKLPGSGEYVGEFRVGLANGQGRYIEVTGEVFSGPFANGRRHGLGRTTLPNGRTYFSLWNEGRESERSRLVRLAQAGGVPEAAGADDIRIGVGVQKRLPADKEVLDDRFQDMWYAATNVENAVRIAPASSRIMSMWKGQGPLQLSWKEEVEFPADGVLTLAKAQLVPLNLRIDAQNRSSNPLQVVGAYIDVKDSVTDAKPALQLRLGTIEGCHGTSPYSPKIHLENAGWGVAEHVRLRLNVGGATGKGGAKQIGDIEKTTMVDMEPELAAAGLDVESLRRLKDGFPCKSGRGKPCLQEFRRATKIGQLDHYLALHDTTLVLNMPSALEYSWRDAKGEAHDWSHPFTLSLPLGFIRQEVECGEGGSPQIITAKTQKFRLDTEGYRIPLVFQTTLKPGQTVPLILPLEAEKSSLHRFAVVLQLSDGREIRSRPVELTYYRPKWFAEDLQPLEAAAKGDSLAAEDESEYVEIPNFALDGQDLRQIGNADYSGACADACAADPRCEGYTYDIWRKICVLKGGLSSMRLDPQTQSAVKKGLAPPPKSLGTKIVERFADRAFAADGGYQVFIGATSQECEQYCTSDDVCVAFTFKRNARDCYLFDSAGEPPGRGVADSGIKLQKAEK